MNIYIQELKMSSKSTIVWTLSLIGMMLFIMALFPAFSSDIEAIEKIVSGFPKELILAFGLDDMLILKNVMGFYGFLLTYILLIGSIQAMKLGFSILSLEIREKTADFLLVKPVKRYQIVTQKILVALTNLLITNIFYLIVTKITFDIYKKADYDMKLLFMFTLALIITQLFFLSFGLFVSSFMNKVKTVMPITLGAVFGFFVLDMLSEALADSKLSYITPFAYFKASEIIKTGKFEIDYLLIGITLTIVFTVVTYFVYNKKDIPSV